MFFDNICNTTYKSLTFFGTYPPIQVDTAFMIFDSPHYQDVYIQLQALYANLINKYGL